MKQGMKNKTFSINFDMKIFEIGLKLKREN